MKDCSVETACGLGHRATLWPWAFCLNLKGPGPDLLEGGMNRPTALLSLGWKLEAWAYLST